MTNRKEDDEFGKKPSNDDDDDATFENISNLNDNPAFQQKKTNSQYNADANLSSKEDAVAWLNKTNFGTSLNGKFKMVRENPDGTIEIRDWKDFVKDYSNVRIQITSAEDGKTKFVQITDLWDISSYRREYKFGFDFDPSFVGHKDEKYNLFKGYKLGKGIAGDVAPFLEFMKDVICAGNERDFAILEALIAQMFQFPRLKPGIVTVIRGDEGVGKSFFLERLCDLIAPYYFRTSNPEHIFGDHNGQLKHVLLLHLEEAVWPGGKKSESLLKDMITNPTIPINDKFVPVYTVPNHLHLFITGNPEWLIAAGPRARRLFALHASEAHRRDTQYFGKLYEWFRNGGDAALLHHFLNVKFEASLAKFGITDLRSIPVTREHIEQQKQSMSGIREWAVNWTELGEWPYGRVVDGHVRVIKSLLCHDYNNSPLGKRHPLTERQFGIQFLALFPLVVDGQKEYADNGRTKSIIRVGIQEYHFKGKQADAYDIPTISELRAVVDFNFGGASDWEEKAEWTIRYGDNKVDLESRTVIHKTVKMDDNEPF